MFSGDKIAVLVAKFDGNPLWSCRVVGIIVDGTSVTINKSRKGLKVLDWSHFRSASINSSLFRICLYFLCNFFSHHPVVGIVIVEKIHHPNKGSRRLTDHIFDVFNTPLVESFVLNNLWAFLGFFFRSSAYKNSEIVFLCSSKGYVL